MIWRKTWRRKWWRKSRDKLREKWREKWRAGLIELVEKVVLFAMMIAMLMGLTWCLKRSKPTYPIAFENRVLLPITSAECGYGSWQDLGADSRLRVGMRYKPYPAEATLSVSRRNSKGRESIILDVQLKPGLPQRHALEERELEFRLHKIDGCSVVVSVVER